MDSEAQVENSDVTTSLCSEVFQVPVEDVSLGLIFSSISLPRYIQANYTTLFQIDPRQDSQEDYCVFVHTNKLCVHTLAPSHPLVRLQQKLLSITFQTADGSDRSLSHGQGHRKKGAQFLTEESCICHISCENNVKYDVVSAIKGKLLEVNKRLQDTPQLLTNQPFSDGFLAIIMPNETDMTGIFQTLCSAAMYQKLRFPQENATVS